MNDPSGQILQVAVGAVTGLLVEIAFQAVSGELSSAASSAFRGEFGAALASGAKIGISTGAGALTGGLSAVTRGVAAYGAVVAVGAGGGAAKAAIDQQSIATGALFGAVGGATGRLAGTATRNILDKYVPGVSQDFATFVQVALSTEGKVVSGAAQQIGKSAFPDAFGATIPSTTTGK